MFTLSSRRATQQVLSLQKQRDRLIRRRAILMAKGLKDKLEDNERMLFLVNKMIVGG